MHGEVDAAPGEGERAPLEIEVERGDRLAFGGVAKLRQAPLNPRARCCVAGAAGVLGAKSGEGRQIGCDGGGWPACLERGRARPCKTGQPGAKR
ncbi:MAG: hypothetical protein BroJett013_19860 [Alphaproteobacteria bacterium]|nr:MAG: hypothetical protein BroJett013_19860 [Alphaproteobacteria bacterium]